MATVSEPYIPSNGMPSRDEATDEQIDLWVNRILPMQFRFSERFHLFADVAWQELVDESSLIVQAAVDSLNSAGENQPVGQRLLWERSWDWAVRHHVGATWVVEAAYDTAKHAAMTSVHGVPPPQHLLYRARHRFDVIDPQADQLEANIVEERISVRVNQVIAVPSVAVPALSWDTQRESKKAFRQRAARAFDTALDETLAGATQETTVFGRPASIQRYLRAIDWTIRALAGDASKNQVKKDTPGTSYRTIERGIDEVVRLLCLPKPDFTEIDRRRRRRR